MLIGLKIILSFWGSSSRILSLERWHCSNCQNTRKSIILLFDVLSWHKLSLVCYPWISLSATEMSWLLLSVFCLPNIKTHKTDGLRSFVCLAVEIYCRPVLYSVCFTECVHRPREWEFWSEESTAKPAAERLEHRISQLLCPLNIIRKTSLHFYNSQIEKKLQRFSIDIKNFPTFPTYTYCFGINCSLYLSCFSIYIKFEFGSFLKTKY